jgi:hypothetical protein
LKGKKKVGPALTPILVRLHEWTIPLEAEGDTHLPRMPVKKKLATESSDAIEQIAETLIEGTTGIERQLLSKSLQETIFQCSGFVMDLSHFELRNRVRKFLRREGPATILQRFLSSYFFNFVWFHTGESFRARAWTPATFENDMEMVEELCRKAVAETWKSSERTVRQLNASAARQLIRAIEESLRGKA